MSETPLTIVHWVSWADIADDPSINDEVTEDHRKVLVDYLSEHNIKHGGYWHQSTEVAGVPVFSDGVVGLFSLRSWGGIVYDSTLAADHNPDDYDPMGYCEYAWNS